MKKSILMIFAVFAVAVLAVAASGCLSSADEPQNNSTVSAAPAQSVIIYTQGDNVMASVTAMIMGTHSQTLDTDNVSVNINGNRVDITIPAVNSSPVNTRDLGYEQVTVVLGKKDQFTAGQTYTVTVGGREESKYTFEIVDGTLYSFMPASIESLTVETNGNDIVATALIAIGGGSNSIDTENITQASGFNADGEHVISIPLKIRDGPSTMEMKWGEEKFTVGQLDQMENGTYTVNVNGYIVSFTLTDGQLTLNA